MRIAGDLQAAVAGRLRDDRPRRRARCRTRCAPAITPRRGPLLASIAATARDALADVRRVLGILRRDGQAPPLTPAGDAPGTRRRAARAPEPPAAAADPPARRRRGGASHRRARARPAARRRRCSPAPRSSSRSPRRRRPAGRGADRRARSPRRCCGAAATRSPPAPRVLAAVAVQSALLDLDAFPVFDIAAVVCATYAIGAYAERRAAIAGLGVRRRGRGGHAAIFYPDGVVPRCSAASPPVDRRARRPRPPAS